MSRYLSPGLLAVGLGLAATACSEPDLNTNLRPSGPPDVLAVLTRSPLQNPSLHGAEPAVKCRYVDGKRDPKAPAFVGDPLTGGGMICPETQEEFMTAAATLDPRVVDGVGWAVRVMFDELLDGDKVETLIDSEADPEDSCEPTTAGTSTFCGSLADTHPLSLKCGATEVGYTGFYVPNGNNVTYPLGPSVFFAPNSDELVFPTGTMCKLTLDTTKITDKDGVAVPTDDLSVFTGGAIDLKIADLALESIDPAEGATISPDPVAAGAVAFVFNASLDDTLVEASSFQLKDSAGADIDTTIFVGGYNADLTDAVYVYPDTPTAIFLPGDFSATMKPSTLTEALGGTLVTTVDKVAHFKVAFAKTGQTSGTDLATNGLIRISFNNTIDPASVVPAQFELFQTAPVTSPPNAPVAFTVAVGNSTAALANVPNNALVFTPAAELPIGTYAVRLKAATVIKDVAAPAHEAKFSAPLAITYAVLLKSTHTIPANAGNLVTTGNFDVVFSGTLDWSTVDASDFALIDTSAANAPVPFAVSMQTSVDRGGGLPPHHANDTVRVDPTANLIVGHVYELTIKQGAVIKSGNGVTRTFAAPSTSSTNRTKWTFTAN